MKKIFLLVLFLLLPLVSATSGIVSYPGFSASGAIGATEESGVLIYSKANFTLVNVYKSPTTTGTGLFTKIYNVSGALLVTSSFTGDIANVSYNLQPNKYYYITVKSGSGGWTHHCDATSAFLPYVSDVLDYKNGTKFVTGAAITNESTYVCNILNLSYSGATSEGNPFYTSPTYETRKDTFIYNITTDEPSAVSFVYNGVIYSATSTLITGNNYSLESTIDIPLLTGGIISANQWKFNITYSNGTTISTDSFFQNVYYLNFSSCNPSNSIGLLNFTTIDEINGTLVNTTLRTTFNYWLGSGSLYRNYSTQFITENNTKYTFCGNANYPYKLTSQSDFDGSNLAFRQYFLQNATVTSNSTNINMYMLNDASAQQFFINVKNGINDVINGVVFVQKYFTGEGLYKTISARRTDETGAFTEFLELDKQYRFVVVENGQVLGQYDKTASCQSAPCSFTIALAGEGSNPYTSYFDQYADNVLYSLTFNQTDKIVTYSFVDTTGTANYFRLLVTGLNYSSSGSSVCDTTLSSVAGTLTCNVTGYTGEFTATGTVSRSPEKIVNIIRFIISTIKESLGLTIVFLSLLILITLFTAGTFGSGGNVNGGLFLLIVGLISLKLIEWLQLSWTVISLLCLMIGFVMWQVEQ